FKIQQLGYFDNVEEDVSIVKPAVPTPAAGEEFDPSQPPQTTVSSEDIGELDVNLKVTEVGRNQVSFGGGVSALEGAFVQLGYATRNLFGRGQTFSFNGQFGGRTTSARLSFAQPYLFDKSIRFGFDLYRTNLNYIDFQQESNGISTRLGFPLDRAEFTTLYLEYNYNYINIGDISNSYLGLTDPIYNALFFTQGRRTTSSVRPNLIYNTINNPFNPSRGRRHVGSLELAGGPLGGSLDFYKAYFTTTWYMPTKVDGLGIVQRRSALRRAVRRRRDRADLRAFLPRWQPVGPRNAVARHLAGGPVRQRGRRDPCSAVQPRVHFPARQPGARRGLHRRRCGVGQPDRSSARLATQDRRPRVPRLHAGVQRAVPLLLGLQLRSPAAVRRGTFVIRVRHLHDILMRSRRGGRRRWAILPT
ncbi:MAG: BamA/TamA family outer membrane protein, partial [Acidobacteriota bacterium]